MGKFCIKILITGLIMSIAGFVVLAVEFVNGYIDEMPSLPVRSHAQSTYYAEEFSVVTTMLETVPIEVFDEVTFVGYDYITGITDVTPDEVQEIDISISMGTFDIVPGDSFQLFSDEIITDYITFSFGDGCLTVDYSPGLSLFNWGWDTHSPSFVLTVPEKIYEKVNIDMDAGTINVTELSANDFIFDMSAGEAYITDVAAYHFSDIKMSAGYSAFTNCSFFNENNIKVSAGDMEFDNSSVTGNSNIKVSAGALYMYLTDDLSLYNISAEKSAGEIYINDEPAAKEYNAHAATSEPVGTMDIKVSAGSCYINFEEE